MHAAADVAVYADGHAHGHAHGHTYAHMAAWCSWPLMLMAVTVGAHARYIRRSPPRHGPLSSLASLVSRVSLVPLSLSVSTGGAALS